MVLKVNISFVLLIGSRLLSSLSAQNYITTGYGSPVSDKQSSITVGPNGPLTLDNIELFDELIHFGNERIPPRVVHAKGTGAFGYFEVTNNITQYCAASIFSEIGKKTKIAVRFSPGVGEKGVADTKRNVRGFCIKFYTDEGNWDVLTLNFPILFVQDAIHFPMFAHALKPQPDTNTISYSALLDFATLRPESLHFLLYFLSDLGLPDGYRHIDGFAISVFKLVNSNGEQFYCRFNFFSDQGIKNLTSAEASAYQLSNEDYFITDLYSAISEGNYPSWTMKIQVMTMEEAAQASFNIFDATKVWPEDTYPNIEVGKVVLNENPTNHFAQIEQMAFSAARLVPGILPSPDRILQARVIAYTTAQTHRLGSNFLQLPPNSPLATVRNYQRDGPMTYRNQGDATNYFPNSFDNLTVSERSASLSPTYNLTGLVGRYDQGNDDIFSQPKYFFENILTDTGRKNVTTAFATILGSVTSEFQLRWLDLVANISEDLYNGLVETLGL